MQSAPSKQPDRSAELYITRTRTRTRKQANTTTSSPPTTPSSLTPIKPTLLTQANNAHLQRPNPADPDLEGSTSGHAVDALEVDALPPAAAGGLAPEEQQLLGHADGAAAHVVAADVGAQARQRQRADDGLVGLARAVAPVVVVVEAAADSLVL